MQKIKIMTWRNCFVVLAIAVVGVVIFPFFEPLDSDPVAARFAQTKSMLWVYGNSIEQWSEEHKRAPTAAEGLDVLELRSRPPRDGWGQPLIYRSLEGSSPLKYSLHSIGPNGIDEGGEGDDLHFQAPG